MKDSEINIFSNHACNPNLKLGDAYTVSYERRQANGAFSRNGIVTKISKDRKRVTIREL